MAKRQLSEQRQRFVDEYLIDLNATQAAIRAGYSVKTAQEQSSRLLSNVMVQQAIAERMAERSKRTGINQDRVLLELAKIAFLNPVDVIDPKTATVRADAASEDTAAIQSVKVKQSYSETGQMTEREIKMADKLKALELLGKHLGMYQNNVNVSVESSQKLDDIISQLGGEGLDE